MSNPGPVNLILVFVPGCVDVEDYKKIAFRINEIADNISIYILPDRPLDNALTKKLADARTLVFSPMQLKQLIVKRGRVYAGRPMLKTEQMLRLQLAGVPVPDWTPLDRGKQFDSDYWGDYVVIKPEISSRGRGVIIEKTLSLNANSGKLRQYMREGNNLIVQRLIPNRQFGKVRILMLFDEVLYGRRHRFSEDLCFDTYEDMKNYERCFTTTYAEMEYYDAPEVFKLAKKCYRTFDNVALLGLDIVLDEDQKPFFIEANPGGNTWHFSSTMVGQGYREKGIFLEQQFNAFDRVGNVLARRAQEDAI